MLLLKQVANERIERRVQETPPLANPTIEWVPLNDITVLGSL